MSLVTNYGFSQTYKCRNKKPNLLPCEKMIILVYQVTVREVASLGGLPQISKQLHPALPHHIVNKQKQGHHGIQ